MTANCAEAEAKALVTPGGRIYYRNLDTDDWSEIPNRNNDNPQNGVRA